MRISDWSSDVCSSDLNRNRVRDEAAGLNEERCGRKAAPPFLTLFLFFRHLRGLYLLVKPGLAVPRREGLTVLLSPAGRQFGQIGRASCRERVCQYVSITGVAV